MDINDINNMSDEEVARHNEILGKKLVKKIALHLAVTAGLIVVGLIIADKIDAQIPAAD